MNGRAAGTGYAPLDAGTHMRLSAAAADVAQGFAHHRAWRYLASEHVKNSYRRTVLGPWWLTAQSVLYVLGLAVVFGQLLKSPLHDFLPYVTVGYLTFVLLSGMVRSGMTVFTGNASLIKSTPQPLSSLVLRSVMIELIQFGHNAVMLLLLLALGLITPSVWLALVPLALVVILLNGVAVGLWLGILVARFRDIAPAVESVLQVIVFFVPVFYKASDLHGSRALLLQWNPFTYFIDFLRSPLLGTRPTLGTLAGVGAFTAANLAVSTVAFSRLRSRLPYWVS
jgi:lipopolysaccharide transport system permease protein